MPLDLDHSRLRRVVPFALLGVLVAAAASVTSSARLERADYTMNNGTEVSTLDPAIVTGVPEGRVIRALYEGLVVKHPETLAPLPGMAESWEISKDGLEYTFHIREGARWTNGDPVTAHDFVYSWKRLLDPNTGAEYAYQLWYVEGAEAYTTEVTGEGQPVNAFDSVGIRAADDHTLRVRLRSPTPYFLDLVGFYPLFPVNQRCIEEALAANPDTGAIDWLRPENLVTNGPFRILDRRINDRIRLVKNETYWDAQHVAMRTVDVLAVEHYGTMLNLYLTGEVDFIDRVATNVVPRLMEREDFDPTLYMGSYFYRVNVTRPPLDDLRVRRALALTIDRKGIAEKIMKKGELPFWSFVPPVVEGYTNAPMASATERELAAGHTSAIAYEAAFAADIEQARHLLAEAGFGPGGAELPVIELLYNTSEAHRDVAEVVRDSWLRNLGVRAQLLSQEWKVYLTSQSSLDYDVSRSAWIGDYADPNSFLDMFLTDGANNRTGWSNPRYDELIAAAARELDPALRMELLHEAEAILMEELPILPIYAYVTQNMVKPRLGGFMPNVQDEHFPKFFYWMDDAELAGRRAALPPDVVRVDPGGPAGGLYPPAGRDAVVRPGN